MDTKDIKTDSYIVSVLKSINYDDTLFNKVNMKLIAPSLYEVVWPPVHDGIDFTKPENRYIYTRDSDRIYASILSDYYQDDILVLCSEKNVEPSPPKIVHTSAMTASFGRIIGNYYYGLTSTGKFAKQPLDDVVYSCLSIIPNLLIKRCVFSFKQRPPEQICGIIENNLGIIE